MKRCLFLLVYICVAQAVCGQTNVSGYIAASTTWTLAGSPYIVTGNILVASGATLTIEPGVTVKFDTTKTLQIDGGLIAIGTAQSRITFTANDATPARGSWGRIQFSPASTDAVFDSAGNYLSGNILKYCDIRYGGGVPGDVTVYCDSAAPYFSNCRIEDCLKHAVYFVNVVGRVDSSSIRNCLGTAIGYTNPVSAALIAKNDTIENNGGGIGRSGSGSFNSITIQNCIFTSTGNAVSNMTSSNTLIENNVFTSNSQAINIVGGNSIISNNVFTSNSTVFHGAPQSTLGTIRFSNNSFFTNTGNMLGDSWLCGTDRLTTFNASNIILTNNYFESNNGIIYARTSSFTVQGNTFFNNQFITVSGCGWPAENFLLRFLSGRGQIINNVFDGNITASVNGMIIKCEEQPIEIANNVFKNNSQAMVEFYGRADICNNRFQNNSGTAIFSYSGSSFSAIPFHNNEFLNNLGNGPIVRIRNRSIINNNEFLGNSNTPLGVTGDLATVSNNVFVNNLYPGNPMITLTNSGSSIQNNDFINNTALSCIRISGNTLPNIMQNNFLNPNIQYEIENQILFGSGANLNLANNYWGTTNTAHIDSVIKDFFDDGSLSVALYTPVLTSPAFVDTAASCSTASVCTLTIAGADTANVLQPATYSINGSSPITWSVTNGVILSGQGTNSIQVDWGAVGQGTVQVTALGCPMISRNITLIAPRRIIGTGITLPFIPLPGQH